LSLSLFLVLRRDKLFQAYHATVDPNHTLLTAAEYEYSWYVPIEVKYKRPEGRGVYAKEFIPNGTVVWESTTRNTATFHTSHDYRRFAEYLINHLATRDLACDITIWIDVQREWQSHNQDEFVICQTMDEAVLLNTAYSNRAKLINLASKESTEEMRKAAEYRAKDCYGNEYFVTSRDIQAGEQLRINYGGETENIRNWWRALGIGH
jgi:hypothetical protein